MIKVENVHKTYTPKRRKEAVKALKGVSFQAQPGKVLALLGPNGSGKTTLLRMMATLLQPDEGEVQVCGFDTTRDSLKVREQIGFLTGSAKLHDKLTARETLAYFGKLYALGDEYLATRMETLIETLEMHSFVDRVAGKLSMGQRQRIMIARTLIHDPAVVVFDEATAGLDVLAAQTLMDIVKACRDAGKTVLFSTHIMGEVSLLADDVVMIHKGSPVYEGSYQQLKEQQSAASLEEEFVRMLHEFEKEGGAA